MRYSIDVTLPGYDAYRKLMRSGGRLRVFFNGEEQRLAVFADDETGELIRRVRRGEHLVKDDRTGQPSRERLKGVVRFEIEEPPALVAARAKRARRALRLGAIVAAGGVRAA